MKHLVPRYIAERVGAASGRTIVEKVDDTQFMQHHTHSGLSGEQQQLIEHAHPYGFVNVPQEPTGSGSNRLGAESFMGFMGGNRSQGVAFVTGDRRFRLYKLAGGEVALHDDQGQQIHMQRDGIWGSVPNSKKVMIQIMDDDTLPQDQSGSTGQKMGQLKQAGRSAAINIQLDKNVYTVNHPNGTVTFNCATFNVNASGNINSIAGGQHNVKGGSVHTIGATHLGVDTLGEPAPKKVPDVLLEPSKQTFVKIA